MYNLKNKKDVGNLGEDITCQFLEKKKFHIIQRNYLKKWGEIDIIALKDKVLTFIEVKTIIDAGGRSSRNSFRPEEKVHVLKRNRLRRTMQTYMAQNGDGPNADFRFHVAVVRLNIDSHKASIDLIENIIL